MRILVVDDSSMMRKIIRRELEQSGFEISEASNGVEALAAADDIDPHLITMDVDMPEMNGFETVRRLREKHANNSDQSSSKIPIIFITSNDTVEGRKKGFEVGATDFIIKPFLKGEVLATVNNLLNPDKTLQGMTALIAEDSALTREILRSVLSSEGINAVLAQDGKEAFEYLKKNEQNVDLVITDFLMPEMNGDELCKRIRFELGNKSLPVIFLSAMSETKSILKIYKAGASDYVVKPFVKEELLARIRVHLESRYLNKKLFEQVHELKRLSKLKDDVLSITSHDLRSPISGMLGFTDLLMIDETLTDTHKEYLSHIKDSGDFLLTLINDLLDLGQAQSEAHEFEMSKVSLKETIDSAVNTVRHMATPKKITIDVLSALSAEPMIMGEKNALIRIFNNLLSNAIKFTRVEGEVSVSIGLNNANKLEVKVKDNGIGIPEDRIPYLFDKFSKASRKGTSGEKSTGLGMSITKELIEHHQGDISVTSVEGEGTCFTLLFPQIEQEEPSEPSNSQVLPINKKESLRFLVVDDNPLNIKLAKTVLSKMEMDSESAENGLQALNTYQDSFEGKSSRFNAIFMDVQMPVMDGFEATSKIREFENQNRYNPIPVFALTAGVDDSWQERCEEIGLNGVISKPINRKQLETTIEQLLLIDKD